jgi:hypothetical protein
LSHTSSLFCSGYFGDGGLVHYFSGLVLNGDPPDFSLPSSWDCSHEPYDGCVLMRHLVLFRKGQGRMMRAEELELLDLVFCAKILT